MGQTGEVLIVVLDVQSRNNAVAMRLQLRRKQCSGAIVCTGTPTALTSSIVRREGWAVEMESISLFPGQALTLPRTEFVSGGHDTPLVPS